MICFARSWRKKTWLYESSVDRFMYPPHSVLQNAALLIPCSADTAVRFQN